MPRASLVGVASSVDAHEKIMQRAFGDDFLAIGKFGDYVTHVLVLTKWQTIAVLFATRMHPTLPLRGGYTAARRCSPMQSL